MMMVIMMVMMVVMMVVMVVIVMGMMFIVMVMAVVMMMIMTIVAIINMIITSNSSVAKSPLFQHKQKLFPLFLPPYTTVCESDMCVFVCIGGTMRPSVCFEGRGYHREQLSKGGLFTLRYSQKSHNIE